jgi:hypothetical protein
MPSFAVSQVGSTVDGMNARENSLRTLEITPRERDLLLKYGYPFPDEEQKLRDSKAVNGLQGVRIGAYWIELMVADLIRSAREIRNGAQLDELYALCSALEFALSSDRQDRLR